MENRIDELKQLLQESNIYNDSDFDYIPLRIAMIRKELLSSTKDKVFETRNFANIFEVSKDTYSKFENCKLGSSFRFVFKVISLLAVFGYNPLWIITKDNLLISKNNTDSEFVLNRASVDAALSKLISDFKLNSENNMLALEKFKNTITS